MRYFIQQSKQQLFGASSLIEVEIERECEQIEDYFKCAFTTDETLNGFAVSSGTKQMHPKGF